MRVRDTGGGRVRKQQQQQQFGSELEQRFDRNVDQCRGGGPVDSPAGGGGGGIQKGTGWSTDFEMDPGPGPKPTPGLLVDGMTCLQSVPACVRIADGYKSAIKAIGWHGSVVDGTAQQANQRSAMSSFITAHAKGVLLGAIDPHGIADLLGQFVAQGGKFNMTAGIDLVPSRGSRRRSTSAVPSLRAAKNSGDGLPTICTRRAPFC